MNKSNKDQNKILRVLNSIVFISLVIFLTAYFVKCIGIEKEEEYDYKERIKYYNNVFLGDSITHAYDLNKYFPNINVVNSGVNGDNADMILENIQERVYQYNPTKVFLLVGTNDIRD